MYVFLFLDCYVNVAFIVVIGRLLNLQVALFQTPRY